MQFKETFGDSGCEGRFLELVNYFIKVLPNILFSLLKISEDTIYSDLYSRKVVY